jgi:hypothetical protein
MGASASQTASFFEWSSRTAAVLACITAAGTVNLIYRKPLTQQPQQQSASAAPAEMIEKWRSNAARAWRPLLIGSACIIACVVAFTAPFLTNAAGWILVQTHCDEGNGCSTPYNIFTFIYYVMSVTPMLPGITMLAFSIRGLIRAALRTRQFAVFGVLPPFPGSFRITFLLSFDESAPSLASLSMLGTISVALGLLFILIFITFTTSGDNTPAGIAPFYAFYLAVLCGLTVGTAALTVGSRALHNVPHLGTGSAPQLSMQLGLRCGGNLQLFLCPAEIAREQQVTHPPIAVTAEAVHHEEGTPLTAVPRNTDDTSNATWDTGIIRSGGGS